ncbi:hypothetical protein M5689_024814 [Euphorbia peplus]|nr:hypothetical protein M5689_024814 [Euphorbia peplus]
MDKATGENSETPKEIRKRKATFGDDGLDSIRGIDRLVNENEVLLVDDDVDVPTSEKIPPQKVGPTMKNKSQNKVSKRDEDNDAIVLKDGFTEVAQAVRDTAPPQLQMSPSDIWKLIEDLGIEGPNRIKIYIFINKNPSMLNVVLGCPNPKEQKDILLQFL